MNWSSFCGLSVSVKREFETCPDIHQCKKSTIFLCPARSASLSGVKPHLLNKKINENLLSTKNQKTYNSDQNKSSTTKYGYKNSKEPEKSLFKVLFKSAEVLKWSYWKNPLNSIIICNLDYMIKSTQRVHKYYYSGQIEALLSFNIFKWLCNQDMRCQWALNIVLVVTWTKQLIKWRKPVTWVRRDVTAREKEFDALLPSISSTFNSRVFCTKFCPQKLQSWNVARESCAIHFQTKKGG